MEYTKLLSSKRTMTMSSVWFGITILANRAILTKGFKFDYEKFLKDAVERQIGPDGFFDEKFEQQVGKEYEQGNLNEITLFKSDVWQIQDLNEVKADLENLSKAIETLKSETTDGLDGTSDTLDIVQNDLDSLTEQIQALTIEANTKVGGLSTTLNGLQGNVTKLEESLGTLEQEITTGELAQTINTIQGDVSHLKETLQNLKVNYVTNDELAEELTAYVAREDLTGSLADYVTDGDLTDALDNAASDILSKANAALSEARDELSTQLSNLDTSVTTAVTAANNGVNAYLSLMGETNKTITTILGDLERLKNLEAKMVSNGDMNGAIQTAQDDVNNLKDALKLLQAKVEGLATDHVSNVDLNNTLAEYVSNNALEDIKTAINNSLANVNRQLFSHEMGLRDINADLGDMSNLGDKSVADVLGDINADLGDMSNLGGKSAADVLGDINDNLGDIAGTLDADTTLAEFVKDTKAGFESAAGNDNIAYILMSVMALVMCGAFTFICVKGKYCQRGTGTTMGNVDINEKEDSAVERGVLVGQGIRRLLGNAHPQQSCSRRLQEDQVETYQNLHSEQSSSRRLQEDQVETFQILTALTFFCGSFFVFYVLQRRHKWFVLPRTA